MPADPRLQTQGDLVRSFIERFTAYQAIITYFGTNSVINALAVAIAGLAANGPRLLRSLIQRFTLLGAAGDDLSAVMEEMGVTRDAARRGRVLVVMQPHAVNVLDITVNGLVHDIEVDDATEFEAGDSIRVVNGDGTETEVAEVDVIGSVGAGANGGTVITTVAALTGTYDPANEDVDLLLRYVVPRDTLLRTSVGVQYQTLDSVTVGDRNPVLNGESDALSLSDKVWAECTTAGARGAIGPLTITGFVVAVPKVKRILNPERAAGAVDEESDFDGKYRASHHASLQAVDTAAWALAHLQVIAPNTLRVVPTTATTMQEMRFLVLAKTAAPLTTQEKEQAIVYLEARSRSLLSVTLDDVTLTAVELDVTATILEGYDDEEVWRDLAKRAADFLDFRTWTEAETVDDADLLALANDTPGIGNIDTLTFAPAADVTVATGSFPYLTRVTLRNATTGDIRGADLAQEF